VAFGFAVWRAGVVHDGAWLDVVFAEVLGVLVLAMLVV
jgi:hypothetical protein